MFKLNRKTEYALMALTYLYKHKDLVSVRDISEKLHVPFDTVSKVLQLLNNKGIVGSEKGLHGGYYLKQDFSAINLHDLFQLLEPKQLLRVCEEGPCDHLKQCNIIPAVFNLNFLIKDFLKQITLKELIEGNGKNTDLYQMISTQNSWSNNHE